jgi:hypothetical protein
MALELWDIFVLGDLFGYIPDSLAMEKNPLPELGSLVETLKKSEHFKDVVRDLEAHITWWKGQRDKMSPEKKLVLIGNLKEIKGRVKEILSNAFDLKEL